MISTRNTLRCFFCAWKEGNDKFMMQFESNISRCFHKVSIYSSDIDDKQQFPAWKIHASLLWFKISKNLLQAFAAWSKEAFEGAFKYSRHGNWNRNQKKICKIFNSMPVFKSDALKKGKTREMIFLELSSIQTKISVLWTLLFFKAKKGFKGLTHNFKSPTLCLQLHAPVTHFSYIFDAFWVVTWHAACFLNDFHISKKFHTTLTTPLIFVFLKMLWRLKFHTAKMFIIL